MDFEGKVVVTPRQQPAAITITGTVRDTDGGVLPGTTVVVKGDSLLIGTSAGADGSYRLMIPTSATTLIFSFVGYKPKEVTVGGRTKIDVVLEEEQVSVCVASAKAKGQVPVREQVSVPLEEQPSKVLSCFANACAARATAEQDKICVDTVVQCDVLFLDRNEELQSIRCEIPVHLEEEAPGMTACMQVFAHVVCEQIQAVTNGDGLDIRVMLAWEAEGEQEQEITLVCGIELEEESEKRPAGIIIYFVGMGEDLWDVAKRYRVRMEDIRYKGKEENKPVEKGDKLILICR